MDNCTWFWYNSGKVVFEMSDLFYLLGIVALSIYLGKEIIRFFKRY
jgi:hypothetical protein